MYDQRAGSGPSLDREDPSHRFGVERVRTQSINSFGGKGYQASCANEARRAGDLFWSRRLEHELF